MHEISLHYLWIIMSRKIFVHLVSCTLTIHDLVLWNVCSNKSYFVLQGRCDGVIRWSAHSVSGQGSHSCQLQWTWQPLMLWLLLWGALAQLDIKKIVVPHQSVLNNLRLETERLQCRCFWRSLLYECCITYCCFCYFVQFPLSFFVSVDFVCFLLLPHPLLMILLISHSLLVMNCLKRHAKICNDEHLWGACVVRHIVQIAFFFETRSVNSFKLCMTIIFTQLCSYSILSYLFW